MANAAAAIAAWLWRNFLIFIFLGSLSLLFCFLAHKKQKKRKERARQHSESCIKCFAFLWTLEHFRFWPESQTLIVESEEKRGL